MARRNQDELIPGSDIVHHAVNARPARYHSATAYPKFAGETFSETLRIAKTANTIYIYIYIYILSFYKCHNMM